MGSKTLSGRLRQARKAKGFSASRLDAEAKLTRGHVRQIESGAKPNPEAVTLSKLADALGCSMEWLLKGIGEGPSASVAA